MTTENISFGLSLPKSLIASIYCLFVAACSCLMILLYVAIAAAQVFAPETAKHSPGLPVMVIFFSPALTILWLIGCGMVRRSFINIAIYHLLAGVALLPGVLITLYFALR